MYYSICRAESFDISTPFYFVCNNKQTNTNEETNKKIKAKKLDYKPSNSFSKSSSTRFAKASNSFSLKGSSSSETGSSSIPWDSCTLTLLELLLISAKSSLYGLMAGFRGLTCLLCLGLDFLLRDGLDSRPANC